MTDYYVILTEDEELLRDCNYTACFYDADDSYIRASSNRYSRTDICAYIVSDLPDTEEICALLLQGKIVTLPRYMVGHMLRDIIQANQI